MTSPADDRLQPVPNKARNLWREHWGLFASSVDERMALLVHMTADPVRREGVFTVIAWVDGRRYKDIQRAPVPTRPDRMLAIHRPTLSFEIVEPGRRCTVSYRGDGIEADLEYVTRFEGYRFPTGCAGALYPVENAQRPVAVTGEIRLAGDGGAVTEVRAFDGFGSRDHSWGWFPEAPFRHHEWIAVNLSDRFLQISRTAWRGDSAWRQGGFVATVDRVHPFDQATIRDAYWLGDPDGHLPPLDRDVVCGGVDADGGHHSVDVLLSRATARHHSNRRDPELDRIYEQVTLFCPVRVGEQLAGTAVVEVGKLLERPGVCEEPIPGATGRRSTAVTR